MTARPLFHDLRRRGFTLRTDDADRLFVSPYSELTDPDRERIRTHKAALIALVAEEAQVERTAGKTSGAHSTPRYCIAPNACDRLGICGRPSCIAAEELETFLPAITAARREDNPHRAIERLPRPGEVSSDISTAAPKTHELGDKSPEREEAYRAA